MTQEKETAYVTRKYPKGESSDTSTYCEELDWFFGCWEALIGYRSSMFTVLANAPEREAVVSIDGHKYQPPERSMAREKAAAKGRRVFCRFRLLETRDQIALTRYYEGRNVSEFAIKRAHKNYYLVAV